jgi:hypothetical protein
MTDELYKVNGHVKELNWRLQEDRRQRAEAEAQPTASNKILTKTDVQGDWDAARVLYTTLGGQLRTLTPQDMKAFRRNMDVARANFKGEGVTPQQVIDISSARPLEYLRPENNDGHLSDVDKAKKEIKVALPVSITGNVMRIKTSASGKHSKTYHLINVKMNAMAEAGVRLASVASGDTKAIKRVATWLRKQKLAFECDCERHRYFFRYVATIGGFGCGRQEFGFPKIRNPELRGIACKHVIRVMVELQSSSIFESFITRHLASVQTSNSNKASTRLTEKEAQSIRDRKSRTRQIQTSDERTAENQKQREYRQKVRLLVHATPRMKSAGGVSRAKGTRKSELIIGEAVSQGSLTPAALSHLKQSGMSAEQIAVFVSLNQLK